MCGAEEDVDPEHFKPLQTWTRPGAKWCSSPKLNEI